MRRMRIVGALALSLVAARGVRAQGDRGAARTSSQSTPAVRAAAAKQVRLRDEAATARQEWKFAVSGDSRNCGDVVMPAIAAGIKQSGAEFYWHLGDFRRMTQPDEDIQDEPSHRTKPLTQDEYESVAWGDFIERQMAAFGGLPVYLARGNHEAYGHKTRDDYLIEFADWLEAPKPRAQRLRDDPQDFRLKTYYHWIEHGIDFITLDNATTDEFDADEMKWFETVLHADEANPAIRTIVAGMHEALPESISAGHSMNQSEPAAVEAGRRVYTDLLEAQNAAHKHVYVLASHSHYFMQGIFNTDYWREHGGVLPGWIVGTAGARRYPLPAGAPPKPAAETNVYGYLLATAKPSGEIAFAFREMKEADVPAAVVGVYAPEFVHWCFAENSAAQ